MLKRFYNFQCSACGNIVNRKGTGKGGHKESCQYWRPTKELKQMIRRRENMLKPTQTRKIRTVSRIIKNASRRICEKCDICFPSKESYVNHRFEVHAY